MALEQITIFGFTIAAGLLSGFFYDLYRVIRDLLRLRKIGVFIGDIFFSIILTIFIFALFLFINYAEVRLYLILGVLLGICIYFRFLSRMGYWAIRRLFLLFIKISSLLTNFLKKMFSIALYPVKIIFLAVFYPVKCLGKGFQAIKKFLGIAVLKNLKKILKRK